MTDYHDPEQETSISAIEEPEPWEPWETWLCSCSIVLGITGLIILGFFNRSWFHINMLYYICAKRLV